MPRIPPVTTAGLDDINRLRRHREVTDLMLNFQHDDSRVRTPAEITAGVTPVNYAYPPGDVRRYGAVGNGTTDDSAAIQRAFNVAHNGLGLVHFGGTSQTRYLCGSISVYEDTHVTADDGVIVVKTDSGSSASHIFDCISTLGSTVSLSANASIADPSVSVSSLTGLAVGTTIIIRTAEYKFSTSGRNLELNQITAISGAGPYTLTLRHRLIRNYTTAATGEVVPLTTPARRITFRNVHCEIPSTADGGAFYFQEAYDCKLFDCYVSGAKGQASYLTWRSAFIRGLRCDAFDGQSQSTSGYGYGVAIGEASHNCEWVDSKFANIRENAISLNSKHCGFVNCECTNAYDNAFNTHGDGSEDCYFINCRSLYARSKGFTVGYTNAIDRRIRFINCRSFYSGYIGFLIQGDATGGNMQDIELFYCDARDFGSNTASSYGFYVERVTRARLVNCKVHDANSNGDAGMFLTTSTDIVVDGGEIRQLTNIYPIRHDNVTGLEVRNMRFDSHGATECVHEQGTASTRVWLHHLWVDQDIIPALTNGIIENISFPTIKLFNRGTANVNNNTNVAHGLGVTPTQVFVTGQKPDRSFAARSYDATNFNVTINDDTGAADTNLQNVNWQAYK